MYQCNLCNRSFTTADGLDSHKRTAAGHSPYHCGFCNREFRTIAALADHKNKTKSAKHPHCMRCKRNFDSFAALESHVCPSTTHCEPCRQYFVSEDSLQVHFRTNGKHALTYCEQCKVNFSNSTECQQHITKGHRQVLPTYSVESSRNDRNLSSPIARSKSGFFCEPCDRRFPTQLALRDHYSNSGVHRRTYCKRCEINFEDVVALDRHALTHSGDHFACSRCNVEFTCLRDLDRHYVSSDSHNVCLICRQDFPSPEAQSFHGLFEHSHTDDSDADEEDEGDDEIGDSEEERPEPNYRLIKVMSEVLRHSLRLEGLADSATRSTSSPIASGSGSSKAPEKSSASGFKCPLCWDQSDELSSVCCGHVFCTPCIRRALNEKRQCPLCRKPAELSDLRKTFFNY